MNMEWVDLGVGSEFSRRDLKVEIRGWRLGSTAFCRTDSSPPPCVELHGDNIKLLTRIDREVAEAYAVVELSCSENSWAIDFQAAEVIVMGPMGDAELEMQIPTPGANITPLTWVRATLDPQGHETSMARFYIRPRFLPRYLIDDDNNAPRLFGRIRFSATRLQRSNPPGDSDGMGEALEQKIEFTLCFDFEDDPLGEYLYSKSIRGQLKQNTKRILHSLQRQFGRLGSSKAASP